MGEDFAELFHTKWSPSKNHNSPFKQLNSIKTAIRTTVKSLLHKNNNNKHTNPLGKLARTISLMRLISCPQPNHKKILLYLNRHPDLSYLYLHHDFINSYALISDHIHLILSDSEPEPQITDSPHHNPLPCSTQPPTATTVQLPPPPAPAHRARPVS